MKKAQSHLALLGETTVVLAAMLWTIQPQAAAVLLSAGALAFVPARLLGREGDISQSADSRNGLTLRRLYRQRMAGEVILLLAAVLIHLAPGFYFATLYIRSTAWLVPFIVFVVIELYTAFRIPAEEQKLQNKA